jgi:exopolysaccharide biosynthesis polyprenyl glycosylphosphotransferase
VESRLPTDLKVAQNEWPAPPDGAHVSTLELPTRDPTWPGTAGGERVWAARNAGGERLLPAVASLVLLTVDMALVFGAFMLAYWLRFSVPDVVGVSLAFDEYARLATMVAAITTVLLATHGLFDVHRPKVWLPRAQAIMSSVSTALVLGVAVSYLLGDQAFSRLWFATGWLLAVVSVVAWRSVAHRLYATARDALVPANRVLIVGANRLGQELACELKDHYQVVGYVDNGTDLDARPELPLLGPIAQLETIVHAYGVNELIIALPANRREQVSRLIERGFHRPVTIKFLPELSELLPQKFAVHEFGGRRYIGFEPMASVSWIKRAMDLVLIVAGLVLLSPLLLVVAIAIKLDTPGTVFYRQKRLGKNGAAFWMYKFRSMCANADGRLDGLRERNEASGPLFKMRADPRVTRVGRFIRRWSLDELPQLFNVARGEMSLVGPRPPLPSEVEKYQDWQLGRLRAVPGLTGLWQVSGRSEVPFHDMVRLDLHYIRNWSLGLDIEILLRTIPAVLTNRGAY